jgi:hypothetical protein
MRLRSILSHSAQAIAEGALISLLVVGLIAGTAFAAKPASSGGHKGGGGGTATAACSATPNPVSIAAGGGYTISGWGLKADELVQVNISNSHGTSFWMLQADTSGKISVSTFASWTGTQTVSLYDNGGRSLVFLGSCSFETVA